MTTQNTVIPMLSSETLLAMKPEELDALLITSAKAGEKLKEDDTAHKSSFPAVGKVYCALEVRLIAMKAANMTGPNTSLSTFYQGLMAAAGIRNAKLNGPAMACAVTFGSLVRTGKLPEKDYDDNNAAPLIKTSAIINAVGGVLEHDVIALAVQQLKARTKDMVRNLQALLDSVKDRKPIDSEKAQELVTKCIEDGHIETVLAVASVNIGPELSESQLERCFLHIYLALKRCGTVEQQETWLAVFLRRSEQIKVIKAPEATTPEVTTPETKSRRKMAVAA